MPKIKMRVTTSGSPDGIRINNYVAGREYDINDSLAKTFVGMDVADYSKIRRKDAGEAPENKMVGASPVNKIPDKSQAIDKVIQEPPKQVDEKKKTVRVYQLADGLNISSKKIIKIARKLGIFVSKAASGLSEEEEERIKAAL